MKTDDRDERLASILDEAVRDIDAFAREAPVAKGYGIGRAGRVVAAVAAAAMFVGAVVFAASQFERDAKRSTTAESRKVFASPDFPWTLPIPAGWAIGAARSVGGPQEILNDLRTTFVSTAVAVTFSGPLMVESSLPSGIRRQRCDRRRRPVRRQRTRADDSGVQCGAHGPRESGLDVARREDMRRDRMRTGVRVAWSRREPR